MGTGPGEKGALLVTDPKKTMLVKQIFKSAESRGGKKKKVSKTKKKKERKGKKKKRAVAKSARRGENSRKGDIPSHTRTQRLFIKERAREGNP